MTFDPYSVLPASWAAALIGAHLIAAAVTATWPRPANRYGAAMWSALNWLALNVGHATNKESK